MALLRSLTADFIRVPLALRTEHLTNRLAHKPAGGHFVISTTLTDEKYDKNGKVERSRASQLRDVSWRGGHIFNRDEVGNVNGFARYDE